MTLKVSERKIHDWVCVRPYSLLNEEPAAVKASKDSICDTHFHSIRGGPDWCEGEHSKATTSHMYNIKPAICVIKETNVSVPTVVSFWSVPESRHMSYLIRNSQRQTTRYAKQSFSLKASPSCSRGHSFWRINGPEDTHPSESISTLRLILPVPSKMVTTTDLTDIRLYS